MITKNFEAKLLQQYPQATTLIPIHILCSFRYTYWVFRSCILTVQTLFSYFIVCGHNFMTKIYSNETSTEG